MVPNRIPNLHRAVPTGTNEELFVWHLAPVDAVDLLLVFPVDHVWWSVVGTQAGVPQLDASITGTRHHNFLVRFGPCLQVEIERSFKD